MKIRTRFAPSPTGYLHIGGARTALYNWLFARKAGGTFVLRIEDTDRERSREEHLENILESLKWLGLSWDEGPLRQTERFDLYRSYTDQLEKSGHLYRCTCTPAELEERRKLALKEGRPPRYDGRCRSMEHPRSAPHALRFRMPESGVTEVHDLIGGVVRFPNEELEDLVILRSNGTPTYNFTVVVDDAENRISHVIRGNDHLNNTPKQIQMYHALGLTPPQFAHLPLILGTDRSRLSKRHGAVSVTAYRESGYLPEAMLNFLARIGWSSGDQEIFSLDELVQKFGLEGVGKTSGAFNEQKLDWLNAHYIRHLPPALVLDRLRPFLKEALGGDPPERDVAWWEKALSVFGERAETLVGLAQNMRFLFESEIRWDEKARKKFFRSEVLSVLEELLRRLEELDSFSTENLEPLFKSICEGADIGLGQLAQPVRVALSGRSVTPGIYDVLVLLGKAESLRRLKNAIAEIRARAADDSSWTVSEDPA